MNLNFFFFFFIVIDADGDGCLYFRTDFRLICYAFFNFKWERNVIHLVLHTKIMINVE